MSARAPTRRLVVASGNAHKVAELSAIFGRAKRAELRALEVVSAHALGSPPEIEETGQTFEENARIKASGYAAWLSASGLAGGHELVLADDSGICVSRLGGAPGVHSARFAGPDADDAANNAALVRRLGEIGAADSPAHYACVLALGRVDAAPLIGASAPGTLLVVEGRCEGVVRVEARGRGGFGYDPHFWVDEGARTFAELSDAAKAARSHRGAAMAALLERLPALIASGSGESPAGS